uniref:FAE domain-containing protein n=1 Tax=Oryza brachyantha TaxID=4533 RepID=J3L311_ORYBR
MEREESHAVIFGVINEVLCKSVIVPTDVGVLIFNSSLLSLMLSFTSLIVKHYRMRLNIFAHNLSGMDKVTCDRLYFKVVGGTQPIVLGLERELR